MKPDSRDFVRALENLAELFRALLRDNADLAPLSAEIALCRQYLDIEKLRLGERLLIDWRIEAVPDDALLPPLLLQPLLENAIYHGVEACDGPAEMNDESNEVPG